MRSCHRGNNNFFSLPMWNSSQQKMAPERLKCKHAAASCAYSYQYYSVDTRAWRAMGIIRWIPCSEEVLILQIRRRCQLWFSCSGYGMLLYNQFRWAHSVWLYIPCMLLYHFVQKISFSQFNISDLRSPPLYSSALQLTAHWLLRFTT